MKAHHLINKIKRYYHLLRYAYEIVIKKHLKLFNANQLQIAIKAINNIIKLNKLIPMLLIFKAYFKITKLNPPNPIIKQRAITIKIAIKELRKIQTSKKINNTLRT